MKKISQFILAALIIFTAASCGGSKKEGNAALNDKKAALEKLKKEKDAQDVEIKKLQEELSKIDTAASKTVVAKLVAVAPVAIENFQHYIELRGNVDAENISYVSPRMGPAQVKAVYVRQGQYVKKGQLLLKLDDALQRQQVNAAQQQTGAIKTQLVFAKNVYQRQKNLWDKGIGTEVQLLTSKSNVETLENQLSAANEQVKLAAEQLKTANVYSDVSGVADVVSIRPGEIFQGATAAGPQIQIVNTSSLKVVTNIAENYLTRMRLGSPVVISLPDINKTYQSSLSYIGQSVSARMIGFVAEAKLPSDPLVKPNQTAIVKILDYAAANAVVIPVNTVQTDEQGKYVFVMEKLSNGKFVAKKKPVNMGEVYGDRAEIKTGLSAGEQLITEGYQNIYEGQQVTTAVN
ncbi:MAG: efflux RND transporter periplasmic adaptor subunit [Ferruginibacter sp.]